MVEKNGDLVVVVKAKAVSVVVQGTLQLAHPTSWDKQVKRSKNAYIAKQRPCVLPDVPVYSSSEQ